METVTNYAGRKFRVPTSIRGLRAIIDHPETDGCTFTYEQLSAAGSPPPPEARGSHTYTICIGELCALDDAGRATHSFDDGTWEKCP